ncbi:MAG: hypothetical protein R3306_07210 [Arenibacter algicola]|nr:hypothetical protein [Arenibacter algicola]|tara:strand:- start:821 stop:1387 length:567 start_codon:yes stop_codon:yes gene_type:complete
MKYSYITLMLLLMLGLKCFSQTKFEREHRIKKSQFPSINMDSLPLENTKYIRYYREVDTSKITYTLKFKKGKMQYHIDYNEKGALQNTGFMVKEVDIPTDTYARIRSELNTNFQKTKIKYIQQCYLGSSENVLKNTFQNLMLPSNTYKVMVRGNKMEKREDYIAIFDAEGNLEHMARALPPNYDHVLY